MTRALVCALWMCVLYMVSQGTQSADFVGVLTGDDNLTVYVDGEYHGQNAGAWWAAKWFLFPSKTRVIAVIIFNQPNSQSGFMAVFSNGVVSDRGWRCKETGPLDSGWAAINFSDTSWPTAIVRHNNNGIHTVSGIPTNVHWIGPRNAIAQKFVCRRRFSEADNMTNKSLVSIFSNKIKSNITLYLDGNLTARNIGVSLTLLVDVQQTPFQAVYIGDDSVIDVLFKASLVSGIVTDKWWKCTDTLYTGWYLSEFNDSTWNAAFVAPINDPRDALPLDAQWIGNVYYANRIYCRLDASLVPVKLAAVIKPSTSTSRFGYSVTSQTTSPSIITSRLTTPELRPSSTIPAAIDFTSSSTVSGATSLINTSSTTRFSSDTGASRAGIEPDTLSTVSTVLLVMGAVMATVIIVGLVGWCAKKKRRGGRKHTQETDQWETRPDDVTIGEELGQGAFGKVFKGVLKITQSGKEGLSLRIRSKKENLITVAVKMLEENASPDQNSDFLDEINLMKMVGFHNNIVSLIGCCTTTSPNFLMVEFASKGDLLSYLRQRREKIKTANTVVYDNLVRQNEAPETTEDSATNTISIGTVNVAFSKTDSCKDITINEAKDTNNTHEEAGDSLTPEDMMSFSWQVAQGMEYLSGKGIVHRDLAARNVLVCDDKVVKIADFGLARRMHTDHVYHVTGQHKKLPIKWMSPEAIYHGVFTTKSDVWSYGVLLWEIVTLGGFPYPGIRNNQIFKLLKKGHRMLKPDVCSDEFYQLMISCWTEEPQARPTFSELRHELEDWMQRDVPYLDMDQVDDTNPYYNVSTSSGASGSSSETPDSTAGLPGHKAELDITKNDFTETNRNHDTQEVIVDNTRM